MEDFEIITDSFCDLSDSMAQEMELTVLPAYFRVSGNEYCNYLDGREMPFEKFYEHMRNGESCTTSAINMRDSYETIEKILQQGKDILYLGFSSALSSTFGVVNTICAELSEKYPERKLYAVDTLSASLGEGLLVWYAVKMKKAQQPIEEICSWLEANKLKLCHWFTVEDLNYLKRGGRISAATASVGTLLNIKPVLHVNDDGQLKLVSKVRGRKKSLEALVDSMEKTMLRDEKQMVFICHADCSDAVKNVEHLIRQKFYVIDVKSNYIGPAIGAHTGPGGIGIFFLGEER